MALTTLSQIKLFLNVTTTTQDTWLDALRGAAELAVKNYCGRDFEPQTYTEYLSGSGQRQLVLRHTPVTSITSLYLDTNGNFGSSVDSFPASSLLVQGTDYALDLDQTYNGSQVSFSGIVYRLLTYWPESPRVYVPGRLSPEIMSRPGNIKVTYSAGYSPIPQDLQYAVCLLAAHMKNTVAYGGFPLESERMGEYSYRLHFPARVTLETKPELGSARSLLGKYREFSFGI